MTLGTPIGFLIRNADAKSADYDQLKDVYRPGHADKTWEEKFGFRDHRGGGRSSARTTASVWWPVQLHGSCLVKEASGVRIRVTVGGVRVERPDQELRLAAAWNNHVRCPEPGTAAQMTA